MILHKEFSNNEKGKYFDFTSLYPSVMKYKKYPIGHPVRIINKFKELPLKNVQVNAYVMPARIVGGCLLLKHTDETASSEAAGQCRI